MNLIRGLAAGIVRGVFKVALVVLTGLFVLTVLGIGLVLVVVSAVRFLLTGRRPAVFTTFAQFSQSAQRFRPGPWQARGPAAPADNGDDVVDVQARELRPALGASMPSKAPE